MESFARPMRDYLDELSWFVRASELRLLHVRTTADLRPTAVRLAAAQELHPANTSPWFVLEDPFTAEDPGWLARLERLRAQHVARRERFAEEGEHLPELRARPAASQPLAAFGAQLGQLLQARAPWHQGLVVVLAPTRVEPSHAPLDDLRTLLDSPSLAAVRWVLIEPAPAQLDALAAALGEHLALRFDYRVDDDEAQRDLARLLDAAEQAPPDVSGPARVGAAWPAGASPPPRKNHPPADPEAIDALLRQEGITLPLAGARGAELSRSVLRAAQALRRKQVAEAVRHQARARDLCVEADLPREAVLMELVLGAYLLAANEPGRAAEVYRSASDRAERAGLPDLGAQAHIALGALHVRAGQRADAAVAYARGAELAHEARSAILTIEALRLAGQAQLDLRNEGEALRLWTSAIEVAGAAQPAEAKASSAAEVARALAALLGKRGLRDKAAALVERSRSLE